MDYDEVLLCENCEAELEYGEDDLCDECLDETEDEDDGYCYPCRGTGEGQHESQRCYVCKGTGIERKPYDNSDDYLYIDDDVWEHGDYYEG